MERELLNFGCYLRKGVVYCATQGRTLNGWLSDVDPVFTAPVFDSAAVRQALQTSVAQGNPIVPEPSRTDHDPLYPKYAGVSTRAAFERGATFWRFKELKSGHAIIWYRKGRYGGLEQDPDLTERLPAGSTMDDLCERMIEVLQAYARDGKKPAPVPRVE